jgi:thermitase
MSPESGIISVKVADDAGKCRATQVAEGIVWAVDNGAKIINISLVLSSPSPDLEEAVEYAWERDVLVIAAAGNDGDSSKNYPAYYEDSIAVAATGEDDLLAPLSNYGGWVDVAAPGFNIYSTLVGSGYGYKSGTSFATAYVSGLATLLYGIANDENGDGRLCDEVRAAIEAGCRRSDDYKVAGGRISAAGSLNAITGNSFSWY